MPLAWNKIEVPFGFGIDQSAHRFMSSPPGLTALVNGRWDKDGQLNFRPGYAAVADAPASPIWLFKYDEKLYCTYQATGSASDTVVHACACLNKDESRFDAQGGFVATNALTEAVILERLAVARDTTWDQGNSDSTFNPPGTSGMSGLDFTIDTDTKQVVIAWIQMRSAATSSPRVFAIVLDTETLAVVKPAQEVATGVALIKFCERVKVIKEGTTVHVVYDVPGDNTIRSKDYNLTTRAWGSDTVVVSDLHGSPTWDAAEGGANLWILVYRNTTPRLAPEIGRA